MSITPNRIMCDGCGAVWENIDTLDRVKDPKPGSQMEWAVCPHCRAADNFHVLCAAPDCPHPASCGTPTPHGYFWTCGTHQPNV